MDDAAARDDTLSPPRDAVLRTSTQFGRCRYPIRRRRWTSECRWAGGWRRVRHSGTTN